MTEEWGMTEQTDAAAFYAEHYSDWTVHALPLMVYIPTKDSSREDAMELVQETLDDGAWDIRIEPLDAQIAAAEVRGAQAVLAAVEANAKYGTPQEIIANICTYARAAAAVTTSSAKSSDLATRVPQDESQHAAGGGGDA